MIRARASRLEPVALDELLGRLESVRRTGEGRWMARCLAHGDKSPSLSVRLGDDGRILLHCFSGCSFEEIVAALGLEPVQFFPASDRPPGPKPDPMREAWALFHRLRTLHRPPESDRMRHELRFVGRLILGGTRALQQVPQTFDADRLQSFSLRLVYLAMLELAAQGTPRRRFSPEALWREVRRGGGRDLRGEVFFWARAACALACPESRRGR